VKFEILFHHICIGFRPYSPSFWLIKFDLGLIDVDKAGEKRNEHKTMRMRLILIKVKI
jgi:hypothetical protein